MKAEWKKEGNCYWMFSYLFLLFLYTNYFFFNLFFF
jgi:hypothetical protein